VHGTGLLRAAASDAARYRKAVLAKAGELAAGTNGRENESDFASELAPDAHQTDGAPAQIACELPNLAEGSIENNTHANLLDIRGTLARPACGHADGIWRGGNSPPGRAFFSRTIRELLCRELG